MAASERYLITGHEIGATVCTCPRQRIIGNVLSCLDGPEALELNRTYSRHQLRVVSPSNLVTARLAIGGMLHCKETVRFP